MVEPTHFRIDYVINPFMDTAVQPDAATAWRQWHDMVETLRGQRAAASLAGVAFALLVALALGRAFTGQSVKNLDAANSQYGTNVNGIARLLFTKYLFAFELTSALLIVAAVGAMVLAHIEHDGPRPSQKALARARIRSGRPQPLPGPGVLSSGNAVGTPALLPDGSVAPESLLGGSPINAGPQGALPSRDGSFDS